MTSADIPAMLEAVTDLDAYKSANELSNLQLAVIGDFDSSGGITNRDIQGMLDLLASQGGGSESAVPEPDGALLAALGLLIFARRNWATANCFMNPLRRS